MDLQKFTEHKGFGAFVVGYSLLLPPIGLFFLWRYRKFSSAARWLLTAWGLLFTAFLVLFFAIGLSDSHEPSQALPPAIDAPRQEPMGVAPVAQPTDLGVSIQTFVERFNDYQEYVGSPTVIKELDVSHADPQKGETNDVMTYQFGKRLALVISTRLESDQIRDVTIILQDDGTEGALLDIFGVVEGTVAAIMPAMPVEDRLDFVRGLGFDGNRAWGSPLSVIRDGVKYTRQYSEKIGLIVGVESLDGQR